MCDIRRPVAITLMLLACASAITIGETQMLTPEQTALTDTDVMLRAVVAGASVGMVVLLPPELGPSLGAAQQNTGRFLNDRSAFGLWTRRFRLDAAGPDRLPPKDAAGVHAEFQEFVSGAAREFETWSTKEGVAVIRHRRAPACRSTER